MIPLYVVLAPLIVPALLEALGPRRPRPIPRLLASSLGIAALAVAGLFLFGGAVALGLGALGALAYHVRNSEEGVFGALVEVALLVAFVAVVFTAAHVVVSSASLSLTALSAGAGLFGGTLLRGGRPRGAA